MSIKVCTKKYYILKHIHNNIYSQELLQKKVPILGTNDLIHL